MWVTWREVATGFLASPPSPRKVHISKEQDIAVQGGCGEVAKRLENTLLSGFGRPPPADTAAHKVSDVPSASHSEKAEAFPDAGE